MYFLEENKKRCRVYWADGGKFKCNISTLFFDMPLQRETATRVALLAAVLKEGCKPYPTPKDLAIASEELYGGVWDVSVVKKGNRQLLLVSMDTVKLVSMEEVIGFMHAILLEPLVKDGGFLPEIVERKKKWLKTQLEQKKDDKRSFAKKRCLEEAAKGSPYGVCGDGYVEDLAGIDGKGLYDFYEKMMQQAKVSIVFVGDETEKQKMTVLRKHFSGMAPLEGFQETKDFISTKPNFLLERMEVTQSRLVMAFFAKDVVYGTKSYATFLVMNRLLGEGADSLLFQKIREEKNLCYDVGSSIYPLTGLLFVQMGIQEKDAKEGAKGVLSCVETLWKSADIKRNLRQKLKEAKTSLQQEYEGIADAPWQIANFVADGILMDASWNLEDFLEQIERVSLEEIQQMARNLRLQTIYLLANQEECNHDAK
ncbi:pitrilysin family protein [Chakrabartyella piscis]|uniref:M16 family metallopeptidase n=1 Tax=Chakrabartyella piscis TaxID=2918914 RepID=UPI002958AB5E|nr:pitrilysin family protein [Chakrabartyella piscis]